MSVKSFINSRNGRAGIFVTALAVLAIALAAATVWWFIYLPQSSLNPVDKVLLSSSSNSFVSVELVDEQENLPGLPSRTLDIHDSFRSESPNFALDYAKRIISSATLDSLVNTHVYRENPVNQEVGVTYDFTYYSSHLNDYEADGSFDLALDQFNALLSFGAQELQFTSVPIASGGRELTISLVSDKRFTSGGELNFQRAWNELITDLEDSIDFESGSRVALSITDASGKLTLKTILTDQESFANAHALRDELWHTFSVYLYSTFYGYLDAQRIVYALEKTSEDSVLSVYSGENSGDQASLVASQWAAAREGEGGALFPGSYITYIFKGDASEPYVTFPATSVLW